MRLFRDFYYDLKPFLPLALRLAFRKRLARYQLKSASGVWPISPRAGKPPVGWDGWPGGKRFALILTHDVESGEGLEKCKRLMQLESSLGFCSSFNFIPEGSYRADPKFLANIKQSGFEVGVHDLHHNGKLYRSKRLFEAAAPRINRYLGEWGAVGFRSGFMHRNLDWLHALDIEYDMSTFDTDPFEPQPDGVDTIFPFFVKNAGQRSYVELPYTLPQDSTLFLLLGERDFTVWKQKLDWIANCGGMALINVHPDYLDFGEGGKHKFPAQFYKDFLDYAQREYGGDFCHMLPREAARHMRVLTQSAGSLSTTPVAIASATNLSS